MKDIAYQQDAIKKLTEKTVGLINVDEKRQKIVFKAPTGSGKTYMTARAMENVAEELKSDPRNRYDRVAFVWIAPNRLHSQAYDNLKKLFGESKTLNPIMPDSITDGKLNHGDVLCLNWGSIHQEDNILVRETESKDSLWTIMDNTRNHHIAIVAIIDEEHLHWDRTADRASKVLAKLNPIVELRVSATPKTNSVVRVEVKRKDVVAAQMIKEGIVINPDITVKENQEVEDYLIDEALKKRDLLAASYEEMGKKINPLLLIQLPNDNATISAEDKTMRDEIVNYLREKYDITTDKGSLAIWLSDKSDKINLEDIEKNDSLVKVLLFKEAIAKGWDCPRAAVLLIFRKLQSNEFAIQTLGRILRMPEQKYYFNPLLNKGYVYTNISKDRIVVAGEEEDYWKNNVITTNQRPGLNNITLDSVYEFYAGSDRNRLGSDFKKFLFDYIKRHWLQKEVTPSIFGINDKGEMIIGDTLPDFGEDIGANRQTLQTNHKIRFDVKGVTINIPKDLQIQNEEAEIHVKDSMEYSRSNSKIQKIFVDYCRGLLTKYEKAASTPVLMGAIYEVMEELFGLPEWETSKVILSVKPVNNYQKFTDIFTRVLDDYYPIVEARKKAAKERSFTHWLWSVPESRTFNADINTVRKDVKNNALATYVQSNKNYVQERNFVTFLEQNSDYIDWWYKNGDSGRQNFAIEYFNPDMKEKRLFYVDFIIRLKNGDIYLFDTKGEGLGGDFESEQVLVAKHNALNKYVASFPKIKGGGIIKHYGGNWRFSKFEIDSTDVTGWSSFIPEQLINE